jgi:hypothetical protein
VAAKAMTAVENAAIRNFCRESIMFPQDGFSKFSSLSLSRAREESRARDETVVIARSISDEAIQVCFAAPGLLRGACHRAGIRPTRWLAMTA